MTDNIVEVDPCWAVFHRHMQMPGGVFGYGSAEIDGYFDSFKKADEEAKKIFEKNIGAPDLHVWVMKCLKTYQNGGIAVERKEAVKK